MELDTNTSYGKYSKMKVRMVKEVILQIGVNAIISLTLLELEW